MRRLRVSTILTALDNARTRAATLTSASNLRIKSVTDAVGNTATFRYNGANIATISDPAYGGSTTSFSCNSKGNITGITFADGDKATFTYNGDTLLATQTDTDGYKVEYTYSGDNRVIKVHESTGSAEGQTYGITYNTDNSTTFRFSGVDDVYGNSDDILNIYVFDEQGRATCIYSMSVSENKVLGATACTYQSDSADSGTRNKIKDSAVVGTVAVNYGYDTKDRLASVTRSNRSVNYSYNAIDQLTGITHNGFTYGFTYDEAGHPLNYTGTTMTWNVHDNLSSVVKGSNKISYTYLSDGSRRSKTVNGTTTTYNYNNGLLLSETTGTETLHYYYDSTGRWCP